MSRRLFLSAFVLALVGLGSQCVSAAVVGYSGRVFLGFTPVENGYVVAGTFAPGFDASNYTCFYGDEVCNLNSGAFESAVTDGNFLPIGFGELTDSSGFFSAAGTTAAATGTPIWLFAFADDSADSFFQVLASSTDSSWLVPSQPAGITELVASDANIFVMGESHPLGVSLSVIPFPEPSALLLLCLGALGVAALRRSRGSR
jgi:hypothetical protein